MPVEGLKVYMSADMEGVAGAVIGSQLGPEGFDYERFRGFMTAEVNAAIAAVREVAGAVGPMEGAIVKWHSSRKAGRSLMPEAARALIREKTLAGLKRRDEIAPFRIEGPLTLDLSYKNPSAAEMIACLPNVERIGSHTVRFVGDIVQISMSIEMALGYPAAMKHWGGPALSGLRRPDARGRRRGMRASTGTRTMTRRLAAPSTSAARCAIIRRCAA